MRHLAAVWLLSLSLAAGLSAAQAGGGQGGAGNPPDKMQALQSKDGFGGQVVAVTDEDWAAKWDTPPDTKPTFTQAGTVPYGKQVFVLTFFANPKLDAGGRANVRCDFRIVDPQGKVTLDQKDVPCYAGPIAGSAYNVRLSEPVIRFVGDPGDPSGAWAIEVLLRDAVRDVTLPLRTTFVLK